LAGGEDGLDFYRALTEKAQELLAPQGIIAVECGFDQAIKIQALFAQKGMETLLLQDLSGINRVVVSRRQV
jgi:release factor glutamine methyltransferase